MKIRIALLIAVLFLAGCGGKGDKDVNKTADRPVPADDKGNPIPPK